MYLDYIFITFAIFIFYISLKAKISKINTFDKIVSIFLLLLMLILFINSIVFGEFYLNPQKIEIYRKLKSNSSYTIIEDNQTYFLRIFGVELKNYLLYLNVIFIPLIIHFITRIIFLLFKENVVQK